MTTSESTQALIDQAVSDGLLTPVLLLNPPGQGYEAKDIHVGTVDGRPLTIDVRLSHRVARDGRTFETTEHEQVTDAWELSISGQTPDSGGQIIDALADLDTNNPQAQELASIWQRWHLNGMRAACAHQTPALRGSDGYDADPCPETGYRYGHAWLHEPLPDEVVSDLLAILRTQAEANRQAPPEPYGFHKFIADREVGMTLSDPRHQTDRDGWDHRAWTATLKLDGRTLRTQFRQGMAHTEPPSTAQVLSAIVSDARMVDEYDIYSFEHEMGYTSSAQARKVYRACEAMQARLITWLDGDADLFDELAQLESV